MKNKSWSLVACLCVAGFLICGSLVAALPDTSAKIGVAAGITGEVKATTSAGETRVLKGGDPLFRGDTVTTSPDSRMQILLVDQTVFTIGASSSIKLDEFVYDPKTDEGKLNADIVTGAFRFISGKIARKKPENMSVDLPAGHIGIRGTFVAGQSQGQQSLVVLLGGPNGQSSGAINVSNTVNGQLVGVNISQSGFGTVIGGPNVAPLDPFLVPPQDLMKLANALGQQVGRGGQSDGAAETLGGDTAGDVPSGSETPDLDAIMNGLTALDYLNQQSRTAAQDAADDAAQQAASHEEYSGGSSNSTGSGTTP
ncbi:MAG TPA: FecR domain-containing protein [Candidatus Omnitrophota bacterium]|jgi:hypothetical protein|nr:MAG: FecR protein [Candidatus Omnitrophica bacterium ADurb.Bin314]HOE68374.1 FecR domain-containing protein [Candidatus Omnitrophota bacterium]HQB93674.1 FecR domain-containing protein [Candidatus Omnitrophota bacterium]